MAESDTLMDAIVNHTLMDAIVNRLAADDAASRLALWIANDPSYRPTVKFATNQVTMDARVNIGIDSSLPMVYLGNQCTGNPPMPSGSSKLHVWHRVGATEHDPNRQSIHGHYCACIQSPSLPPSAPASVGICECKHCGARPCVGVKTADIVARFVEPGHYRFDHLTRPEWWAEVVVNGAQSRITGFHVPRRTRPVSVTTTTNGTTHVHFADARTGYTASIEIVMQ